MPPEPTKPTTPIEPVEDVVGVEAVDPESADEGLIVDTVVGVTTTDIEDSVESERKESTGSEREVSPEPVSSPPAKGESEGVIEAPTLPPVIAPPIEPKLDSFHINMARARELLVKARYVIQLNKKKKMDKIMGLFDKHAPTHIRNRIGVGEVKVTNREVRDLLRLSHDMVNIYMNVLIKEGKIKREGKSSATHYMKL